jgi:hypothetical protein
MEASSTALLNDNLPLLGSSNNDHCWAAALSPFNSTNREAQQQQQHQQQRPQRQQQQQRRRRSGGNLPYVNVGG